MDTTSAIESRAPSASGNAAPKQPVAHASSVSPTVLLACRDTLSYRAWRHWWPFEEAQGMTGRARRPPASSIIVSAAPFSVKAHASTCESLTREYIPAGRHSLWYPTLHHVLHFEHSQCSSGRLGHSVTVSTPPVLGGPQSCLRESLTREYIPAGRHSLWYLLCIMFCTSSALSAPVGGWGTR